MCIYKVVYKQSENVGHWFSSWCCLLLSKHLLSVMIEELFKPSRSGYSDTATQEKFLKKCSVKQTLWQSAYFVDDLKVSIISAHMEASECKTEWMFCQRSGSLQNSLLKSKSQLPKKSEQRIILIRWQYFHFTEVHSIN